MNKTLFTLLQHMELTKLVVEQVFSRSDASKGTGQMDMFPEDICQLCIQEVALTLYKMTKDENYVSGITAMLEAVLLLPLMEFQDDQAGDS